MEPITSLQTILDNFTIHSVYALSSAFLQEKQSNESTEIPPELSVDLHAFRHQAEHGKYRPEVATAGTGSDGVHGVNQNDCNIDAVVWDAWGELGDMPREEAMLSFTQILVEYFPDLLKFLQSNVDKLTLRSDSNTAEANGASSEDVDLQVDMKGMQLQEDEVRELINEQTEQQFKQYVEQQHPGSELQQQELMQQIKEQQYQQYIQYVSNRLLIHQQQQFDQLLSVKEKLSRLRITNNDTQSPSQDQQPQQPMLNGFSDQRKQLASGDHKLIENKADQLTDEQKIQSTDDLGQSPPELQTVSIGDSKTALDPLANGTTTSNGQASCDLDGSSSAGLPEVGYMPAGGKDSNELNGAASCDLEAPNENVTCSQSDFQMVPLSGAGENAEGSDSGEGEDEDKLETEASLADVLSTNISLTPIPPPLLPASLWTRSDIVQFKKFVQNEKEGICGSMKVSSLSSATIKVPTHVQARYICWEFATDYYDLGFGVEFEWQVSPGDEVTVHMSDSEDEEEAYDEEQQNGEGKEGDDLERGKNTEPDLPIDEIIPIYRRDCHKEVFCGSHLFPGNGIYLLRFDNSFSLWRSKWVYYRVYYTK